MRKYVFILSIIGIILLLALSIFLPPKSVLSPQELNVLQPSQKVLVTGEVVKQTSSSIYLSNDFILSCPNCPDYKNKTISAICTIDQYNNRTYLNVLRIKPQSD